MTDVLRFTVHGSTHLELCDVADVIVHRFLGLDADAAREGRESSHWRVSSSQIVATPAALKQDADVAYYEGDVTVHLTLRGRPDL